MFGDEEDTHFEVALDTLDKYTLTRLLELLDIEEADLIAYLLESGYIDKEEIDELDDL
jgi:hypothetical protein